MKYKVIGWTYYDDDTIKDKSLSFASQNAIIDEIIKKGYLFSGQDHQNALYGCPVLNDGKKRIFSLRGFSRVMAEAHGEFGLYDYSRYMDFIKKDKKVIPEYGVNKHLIKNYSELLETFTLEVDKDVIEKASLDRVITIEDLPSLRYIDTDDTLVLSNNGITKEYRVLDVDRNKDISKEERIILDTFDFDAQNQEKKDRIILNAKTLLTIKLKENKKD